MYRIQNSVLSLQQTQQPPATTYRPQTVSYVTQKPTIAATPAYISKPAQGVTYSSGSTRGAIDFDSEFKKFQQETGFKPVTPASSAQPSKSVKISQGSSGQTSNPIYQTQLVYNPSSGHYDSNLYQSIAQTDGEFQLNQRIQPYVQQYQPQPQSQPQYQPQSQQQYQGQTIYRPQQAAQQQPIPQQVYQRQQNDQQFVNSQQLFAQQLQMQQSQLQRDRNEAAKKGPSQSPAHRYQLQQAEPSPLLRAQQSGQQYYFVPQAQQSGGQIEAFLRGHNLEYQ